VYLPNLQLSASPGVCVCTHPRCHSHVLAPNGCGFRRATEDPHERKAKTSHRTQLATASYTLEPMCKQFADDPRAVSSIPGSLTIFLFEMELLCRLFSQSQNTSCQRVLPTRACPPQTWLSTKPCRGMRRSLKIHHLTLLNMVEKQVRLSRAHKYMCSAQRRQRRITTEQSARAETLYTPYRSHRPGFALCRLRTHCRGSVPLF